MARYRNRIYWVVYSLLHSEYLGEVQAKGAGVCHGVCNNGYVTQYLIVRNHLSIDREVHYLAFKI
jgi:hypothetical protein